MPKSTDVKPLGGAEEATAAPADATYRVVVDKIGPDSGWGERDAEYRASDWPQHDWLDLWTRGAVVRLDDGVPVPYSQADDVVMQAQPHREFGPDADVVH